MTVYIAVVDGVFILVRDVDNESVVLYGTVIVVRADALGMVEVRIARTVVGGDGDIFD